MAEEYLARNPELLNEAATLVERWRTEGLFGKRAQALVHINNYSRHGAACDAVLQRMSPPLSRGSWPFLR